MNRSVNTLFTQLMIIITHLSLSLAASFCPSPLVQNCLPSCLLVKCAGTLQSANALPLPGDLPSAAPVLKPAEAAGTALTPTLCVNGRFSWLWNIWATTVDRKCNISLSQEEFEGWLKDSSDESRRPRSSNGFYSRWLNNRKKKILEEGQPNTNYKALDWTKIAHTCSWLVLEDVNHFEISCSRLQNIYTISLFFTDNVIFEHQLFSGIIFKII